jgi:hypothetical protein
MFSTIFNRYDIFPTSRWFIMKLKKNQFVMIDNYIEIITS